MINDHLMLKKLIDADNIDDHLFSDDESLISMIDQIIGIKIILNNIFSVDVKLDNTINNNTIKIIYELLNLEEQTDLIVKFNSPLFLTHFPTLAPETE